MTCLRLNRASIVEKVVEYLTYKDYHLHECKADTVVRWIIPSVWTVADS